ncbi:Uxu operon transcriptional regulator [Lutibaculum baratangense AMV1]|uniref:Uxu operon transcriptional regulator n=1 Tax=Lutibaculum baratangense AMV1 TaxID=631454 RepID=V4R8P0_9HYPH|nr:Uxu operon transcriptional regulator [Lutibaculum baratangense AMV1]
MAARLRDLISSGSLPPGSRLPAERELAEQLNVHRRTIRKALSALAHEGAVTRHVGRGTFVGSTSVGPEIGVLPNSIAPMELMDARLGIEPVIAAEAALRAKQPDLRRMRLCLRHSDEARTYERFEEWDAALHRSIAEATQNVVFVMIMDMFGKVRASEEWDRLKRRSLTPERRALYRRQHLMAVDAIEARDAKQASVAMREHLKSVRDVMIDAAAV